MNYIKIYDNDVVNGPGIRVSLFVAGCSHTCIGCFNPESWNYKAGSEFTSETQDHLRMLVASTHIAGLSVLGGEPLAEKNFETVLALCMLIKSAFPEKDIWLWSGYTLAEIQNNHAAEILTVIDVLCDGRFELDLKDSTLQYVGSSNQKVHKLKEV
jgi:anaerobic ribonucleoside-triphosphate reductase activating protein